MSLILSLKGQCHELLRGFPRFTSCCRLALGHPGERFQRQGESQPLFKGTVSKQEVLYAIVYLVFLFESHAGSTVAGMIKS